MAYIEIKDLTFGYDGSPELVFDHASLRLDTDWKLGFTGRNGKGKTTLLHLLAGQYPYQGTIAAPVSFCCFPFLIKDHSQMTLSILEELEPRLEFWRLKKELFALGVAEEALYRPFDTLSGGEQTKVQLALLFAGEPHFLLIDEPTNHLDLAGRKIVGEYLDRKQGFLLVSHDRAFLDQCVNHMLIIQNTGFLVEKGNFSSWYANQQKKEAFELAENEKLRKEAARLGEAMRRTAGWSSAVERTKTGTRNSGLRPDRGHIGHQSAKMMKRAKVTAARRENALAEKKLLLQNVDRMEALKLHPLVFRTNQMLDVRKLSLFYAEKKVCGPLDFTVRQGERLAVTGPNGSGKSTLLHLLAGKDIRFHGELNKPSDLVVSVLEQDTTALHGSLQDYCRQKQVELSLFLTVLRKLGFTREHFELPLEQYSQGQKKKAAFAASLCKPAHLYLWDEPLNYMDVLSRIQIEALLLEYRPTLLFVEHDSAFVEKMASGQIDLS